MRKYKTGEVATFITLVTFFVIGLASLVSTVALKKPQTTQTKAEYCAGPNEVIEGTDIKCCSGLIPDELYTCRTPEGLTATPTPQPIEPSLIPYTYTGNETAQSCTQCDDNGKCIYHPELDFRSGRALPNITQCTDTGCINDVECRPKDERKCAVNGESCSTGVLCCTGKNIVGIQADLTCNSNNKCEPKVNVNTIPKCQDFTDKSVCDNKCGNRGCEGVPFSGGFIPNCWRCRTAEYCDFGSQDCQKAAKPTPQITPKVNIKPGCWYDSSCVKNTNNPCNFRTGKCTQDYMCCPYQWPTPTPKPNANNKTTPTPSSNTVTGKCHDTFGASVSCPSVDNNYTNPKDPNKNRLVRYAQCGQTGKEDETCNFACYKWDAANNGPLGNEKVECVGGEFGFIQIGPQFNFTVSLINSISEPVIIKSIVVKNATFWGNVDTGSNQVRPNKELAKVGDPNNKAEFTINGAECGVAGTLVNRDRIVSVVYTHKSQQDKEYTMLNLSFACNQRPLVEIKQ